MDAAARAGAAPGPGMAPGHVDSESGWDAVDSVDEFLQLDLTRAALAAIVGESAVARLWALASTRPGRPAGVAPSPAEPHMLFARRYTAGTRPWCPFHFDVALCTVNIALTDDASHEGGRLLAVFDGCVHEMARVEGCATVHPSSLLHAVSRMRSGTRYSLIIFSGAVCPDAEHRLALRDGEARG